MYKKRLIVLKNTLKIGIDFCSQQNWYFFNEQINSLNISIIKAEQQVNVELNKCGKQSKVKIFVESYHSKSQKG